MRTFLLCGALAAVLPVASSCQSTTAPTDISFVKWTIDGKDVSAASYGLSLTAGSLLFPPEIVGYACTNGPSPSLFLYGPTDTNFHVGTINVVAVPSDAYPDNPSSPTEFGAAYSDQGNVWYPTSGTLTITNLDSTSITGSLSATLGAVYTTGNPSTRLDPVVPPRMLSGSFHLKVTDKTPTKPCS